MVLTQVLPVWRGQIELGAALAVVLIVAKKLTHYEIRPLVRCAVVPLVGEYYGVFHSRIDLQMGCVSEMYSFDHVSLPTAVNIEDQELRLRVYRLRVNHERLALPMPDRVAPWCGPKVVLRGMRPTVRVDMANLAT